MGTQLINALVSGVTGITTAIPEAIKTAFENLLFTDPDATTRTLSGFAEFGLVFAGLALASTAVWGIVRMIRNRG